MKIVCLSDTHGMHAQLQLPPADMIIHAGDFTYRGQEEEVADFLAWFSQLPYRYKVFIGGNHDFLLERHPKRFEPMIPDNCVYLKNSGIEIENCKLWGSPITPYFHNWAFNRHRGEPIKKYWDLIPQDTDLLITHGPPYGTLDRILSGEKVGCEELAKKLTEIQPAFHLFGHIHEAYGTVTTEKTTFINASTLDIRYRPVNAPVVIEYAK